VSADIAAIEAQTDDIGVAGAGLTAIPWNSAWDAEVQSEVADALAVYDPPTHAELTSGLDALPTAAEVRAEMDSNSTQLAAIVADTNELQTDWADGGRLDLILDARASQSSVDTIDNFLDTEVAAILEDTGTTIPALIAALNDLSQADIRTAVGLASANLDTQLAALPTAAENADAVWDESTTGHTTAGTFGEQVKTDIDAILVDTGTTLDGKLDTIDGNVDAILVDTGTTLDGKLDTIDTVVDAILADTGTDGVIVASLGTQAKADVNAEVLDVLNTDTFGEPTGVPGATVSLVTKIGYLYMALRNKLTVTSSKKTFYDDGGAAEWEKDLSDDGTTYTESKGNAI
jgi:hypothetical protein